MVCRNQGTAPLHHSALPGLHRAMLWLQDKILQSMGRGNQVMVTNDGATILKSLYVDNPAAKVLVGEHQTCLKRAVHNMLPAVAPRRFSSPPTMIRGQAGSSCSTS